MRPARDIKLSQKCLVFLGGEVLVEPPAQGGNHLGRSGESADYSNALSSRAQQTPTKVGALAQEKDLMQSSGLHGLARNSPTAFRPYASTKNFPSRMICWSSTQISNFRPTTSICVDESHSAPVCAPYGFPNAMCTPGYFSSCRICPITSFKSIFVPMANSPTRSLFSSVWVYRQKSACSSRLSEWASVNRLFFM